MVNANTYINVIVNYFKNSILADYFVSKDMPVSNVSLSLLGAFFQSVHLVRSYCIYTGRGRTCALVAATYQGGYVKRL